MKQISNYENAKVLTGESTQLPKGGYICNIIEVKEVQSDRAHYLSLAFDIAEGEYMGHFTKLFNGNTSETKKWRGVYNLFIPDEGNQYYEDTLTKFKTAMVNFEDSNNGYHWDWNEQSLKGKQIGIIFGEKEFMPEGSNDVIIITEPRGIRSVQQIKEGKFKLPPIKKLPGSNTVYIPGMPGFNSVPADDALPF